MGDRIAAETKLLEAVQERLAIQQTIRCEAEARSQAELVQIAILESQRAVQREIDEAHQQESSTIERALQETSRKADLHREAAAAALANAHRAVELTRIERERADTEQRALALTQEKLRVEQGCLALAQQAAEAEQHALTALRKTEAEAKKGLEAHRQQAALQQQEVELQHQLARAQQSEETAIRHRLAQRTLQIKTQRERAKLALDATREAVKLTQLEQSREQAQQQRLDEIREKISRQKNQALACDPSTDPLSETAVLSTEGVGPVPGIVVRPGLIELKSEAGLQRTGGHLSENVPQRIDARSSTLSARICALTNDPTTGQEAQTRAVIRQEQAVLTQLHAQVVKDLRRVSAAQMAQQPHCAN